MTAINVPSDGNCLLHSIALAFLDPTSLDEEFARRFELLFGSGFDVECDNLYQQFSVNAIDANLYKHISSSQTWETLINRFRFNLVEFMKSKSDDLVNPFDGICYIPNNNDFFNTATFDRYLEIIAKPSIWLGRLEIRAISFLLDCRIVVQQKNSIIATFNKVSTTILTLEYLNDKNHYNFILKCSPIPNQKRKFSLTESEFYSRSDLPSKASKSKRPKPPDHNTDPYKSSVSGLKRALHGTIYQMELLVLLLLRIETLSEFFLLATEMDFAEKFDDAVLKYKTKDDDRYKWRFIQAKHKQDPTKQKISINELTSGKDDDFSLQKYFLSFYKISTNTYFQDVELEDFCILTNTTFDLEIKEKQRSDIRKSKEMWQTFFSEFRDLQDDPILYIDGEESQQVRFNQDQSTLQNLSEMIKSSLQLAITNANKKHSEIFLSLANSNIVPHKIKDQIKLSNKDLSDTRLKKILDIEEKITKLSKKIDRGQLLKLADDILELDVSPQLVLIQQDFTKQKRTNEKEKNEFLNQLKEGLIEMVDKMSNTDDWLQSSGNTDSTIKVQDLQEALKNFDKHFDKFISKFRFVINYPSLDNLTICVSSEIGASENLLTPDLFAHSFEKVMLNWLQEKNSKFLTNNESYDFREDIQVKLQTLMVAGLSKAYPEKLNSYNIRFQNNFIEILQPILTFLRDKNTQLLHLVTSETLLTSLKVLQILKDLQNLTKLKWLKGEDSFIFIQLDSLVLPEIRNIAITSFSSKLQSQNLFIIECTSVSNSNNIEYVKLFKSLTSQKIKGDCNKQIIFIGPENDSFIKKFKNIENIKDETIFTHLDRNSQKNILSQQLVLQGEDIQLGDIVDETLGRDLINEPFLVALIRNNHLIIGDVMKPHFNYNDQYYISRKLQHQKLKKSILNSGLNLFVSNITLEELTILKARKENLCAIENFDTSKNVVFTESQDIANARYYFNNLCSNDNKKSFHWIIFNKGCLEWASSNGGVTNILEHVDTESSSHISKNTSEVDDVSDYNVSQKTVIIADNPGMGKSTLLAHASLKIKESNPSWWVHVINLNDYSAPNHPYALKNIKFDDDDLDGAVDFCSFLVLPSDTERVENKFIRNLFKISLLNGDLTLKLNIVLIFDGFDEISPTYQRETVKLLKCLQRTNIKQLYITTRLHVKNFLETELNFPALLLNHFTNWDKVLFLNKFLKWHLQCKEINLEKALQDLANVKSLHISENNGHLNRFRQDVVRLIDSLKSNPRKEYVDFLIENLDPSVYSWNLLLKWQKATITRKEDVTSNPLHLKMLAKVTFTRNENFNENFNILTLYESFVDGSFQIFFRDKKTMGDVLSGKMVEISSMMNYKKIHQELALKFFMSHVTIGSLFSYLKNETDNFDQFNYGSHEPKITIEEILVQIGLVLFNSNAELTFIHGTIAEYFLFKWLVTHIKEEQVQEILVKIILIEGDYSLTCEFFEIYLNNQNEQLCVFSEKIVSYVAQHDVETYSNNTIIHLATRKDQSNIINFLIDRFKNYDVNYLKNILLATNRAAQTALEVASVYKNVKCFKILLNLYGLYCQESLNYNLVSIFLNYFKILNNQQRENDKIIFQELVLFAKRELHEEGFKRLLSTPIETVYSVKYGQVGTCNILHVMVYFQQKSNIKLILDQLKDCPLLLKTLLMEQETCGDGLTPFYLAVRKNYLEIIDLFLTSLLPNLRLLSFMILSLDNYRIALGLLQNHKTFEYVIEAIGQCFSTNEYTRIISTLLLKHNIKKETIFSLSFNQNIDNKVLIFLLHKLDLQALCEDILVISMCCKSIAPELKYKFLDWFQSCVMESVYKDNNIVLDTVNNAKKIIPLVTEETENLTQQVSSSTPDVVNSIFKAGQHHIISKQLLLSFKTNTCINISEFVLLNSEFEIQEFVLNYLRAYPYIFGAIVLEADALGCTVLHRLAIKCKSDQIKVLLNYLKEFPNIIENVVLKPNNYEETVAHIAARNKNREILENVLHHANCNDFLIDVIFGTNREKRNILEIAIEQRAEDIVKMLLSFINLFKHEDIVDLMLATYKHTENVVFFCFKTSNPTICTILLDFVLEHLERVKVKEIFMESNYLPTISENEYGTLIFAAAQQAEFLVVDILWKYVKILFDSPTDCMKYMLSSSPNKDNFLHISSSAGSCKNVEFYLEELCKMSDLKSVASLLLDQNNSSEMTPLHNAVLHDQPDSLKVLLSFCNKHLILLYPSLLCKLLLLTEISGCTLLTYAVEKKSPESFSLLLSMTKSLEQNQAGILRKLLMKRNLEGRTVLHGIILEGETEMLHQLLEVLGMDPTLLDELVVIEDNNGETILHAPLYEEDDIDNIKTILTKIKYDNTILKALTKENKYGLTPLHKAYYSCDASSALTDLNVQFLLDQMKHRNLNEQTFSKLQKASEIAQPLESAIKNENREEIVRILNLSRDCARELFLMGTPYSMPFLKAAYKTNNVDIVKSLLEFLKEYVGLLKYVFLADSIQLPANICDFEIFSLTLEYARSIQDEELYIHLLLEFNVILILAIKKGNKKTIKLLKQETNKIAKSVLTTEGKSQLQNIGLHYLINLKNYVESNEYNGPSQEEIVEIIKMEVFRRKDLRKQDLINV